MESPEDSIKGALPENLESPVSASSDTKPVV